MRDRFAGLWRWATAGAAWSLPVYLALGLVLRLPAVLWADGYEFVDQQYQYVDPAWHLATGQAWSPTWEWNSGMRSWLYPGFLAGVFRLVLAVGVEDPLWCMRVVRAVHALLSLLPLAMFWLCIVRWRPVGEPRLPLLLFAGSGLLVTLGVQPSGLTWGGTLAVAAVLAFHGPRWFPWLAGLLLGLAFGGRVQDALFGPALFAVGLFQRRWAALAGLVLGCVPGLVLQGLVDLWTYGRFFSSPIAYYVCNVELGAAAKWSQQPWWFYGVLGVLPATLLVPPWFGPAWSTLRRGSALLPAACAAAALHLGMHSCLDRKAIRFEYSALALLLAVVFAGLGGQAQQRFARSFRLGVVAVHAALLLWASFVFHHEGPVRAAIALGGHPEFRGDLVAVDGDATMVGGAYYLRRAELNITSVSREGLGEHLMGLPAAAAPFVVASRTALAGVDSTGVGRLEPVGEFGGFFRDRDRRFVYRLVR